MTDEPNNPPEEAGDTSTSDSDESRRGATDAPAASQDRDAAGSPEAAKDAGTLPPPPDSDQPRPTPESQAAQTGKAPSGSSTSGTTVPADTAKPKPAPPPANETPEEKKARLE